MRVALTFKPYVCHGDGCREPGRYEVRTEQRHRYCRDHLPVRYRALAGLGTVIEAPK